MAKKKTDKEPLAQPPSDSISKLGWKVIAAGALCVLAGFFVLTKADPLGRNWASTVSPLLILAGYAVIGLGIFLPEKTA